MTYTSELTEEDAKQIKNLVEEINAIDGKNIVEVFQDKDDDSYLTVFLAGEEQTDICHDTIGTFSFLKGMSEYLRLFNAAK